MTYEPITRSQARAWIRAHISERAHVPNAASCYFVRGVQYGQNRPGLFLVAGECGLEGVYWVLPNVAAERRAG